MPVLLGYLSSFTSALGSKNQIHICEKALLSVLQLANTTTP